MLRPGSDGLPLWDRLLVELGHYEFQVRAGCDAQPVMVGRYEIQRRAGGGGMGAVFEATDTELGRRVALKICTLANIDAVAAIEHEARSLAKLAHPNVVGVHEVVRYGGDVVLVMEFVQGRTLREWQSASRPSWRDVLDRYLDAANGLAAVHARGIVHGDFKPENVMLGDDGRVRVIDFGIARYSSGNRLDIRNMGTRSYMAPERLDKQPGGPQADVYAFCVSVWESLFGVLPFDGKTEFELLTSIEAGIPATDRDRALPGVPESVRAVLRKGLSASASDRPPSMEALIRALDDAREGHRRRVARVVQWVGGGFVAVLLVGSVVMAWMLATATPELGAVEQTLALAEQEARDGQPDAAIQALELARLLARQDGDVDALRRVAEVAMQAAELLAEQGQTNHAHDGWAIAGDIFIELNDQESLGKVQANRRGNR
jgi:predicted Ser/Thr protein kinase